jgi:hypothetical protein
VSCEALKHMAAGDVQRQVTVAAWGPAFGYPHLTVFDGEQFADQGAEVPYETRSKVVVDAAPITRLGEVIDRAAAQFGVRSRDQRAISEQVPCVAFFREGDQAGMDGGSDRWQYAIRTADSEGSPSWTVRWSEITLEELVAARAEGLIDGDPLRPYFWPVIPQGTLADVASSIYATWALWEHYLSARETVGVARHVLERIRGGRRAVDDDREAWSEWLKRPQVLMPYLESIPRTTSQIATDTGISAAQLPELLLGIGYSLGEDGRWRFGDDPAAGLLRTGVLDIKRTGHGPEDIAEAASRVRALVEEAEQHEPPD